MHFDLTHIITINITIDITSETIKYLLADAIFVTWIESFFMSSIIFNFLRLKYSILMNFKLLNLGFFIFLG